MATAHASVITTTFVPPAGESSVVGYYPSGTDIGTIVCGDEYEFLVSSTYGICCQTASRGECGFKQICSESMMVYEDGSSATCPNNNPCVSTTIYQMSPSQGWSATMAWCMDLDNPLSLYRSYVGTKLTYITTSGPVPHTTTTSDAEPTSTSSLPTTTTSTETTPDPTSPTSTITPIPVESGGSSKTNVGAIAGGAVGGVAGLALILAALWFVWRRQSKKNAEMREIGTGYNAPPDQ